MRSATAVAFVAIITATTSMAAQDASVGPDSFIGAYETALATQDWSEVSPLVHADARVIFSDGSIHEGKEAVGAAFRRNFRSIADEDYRVSNVHWLLKSDDVAAYMFEFDWSGRSVPDDRAISGSGRGTAVLVSDGYTWRLIAEQLTRK